MENEIWKDIPGYEGYYQVSNYGRVKSMYFNAKKTLGYNIKINPKIIKNGVDRHGYLFVRLYLLKDMVKLPVMMYIREVLYKLAPVIVVGFAIPGILILTMDAGWLRLILVCLLSVLVTAASEYFIGLSNKEKDFVAEKIKLVIGKIKK